MDGDDDEQMAEAGAEGGTSFQQPQQQQPPPPPHIQRRAEDQEMFEQSQQQASSFDTNQPLMVLSQSTWGDFIIRCARTIVNLETALAGFGRMSPKLARLLFTHRTLISLYGGHRVSELARKLNRFAEEPDDEKARLIFLMALCTAYANARMGSGDFLQNQVTTNGEEQMRQLITQGINIFSDYYNPEGGENLLQASTQALINRDPMPRVLTFAASLITPVATMLARSEALVQQVLALSHGFAGLARLIWGNVRDVLQQTEASQEVFPVSYLNVADGAFWPVIFGELKNFPPPNNTLYEQEQVSMVALQALGELAQTQLSILTSSSEQLGLIANLDQTLSTSMINDVLPEVTFAALQLQQQHRQQATARDRQRPQRKDREGAARDEEKSLTSGVSSRKRRRRAKSQVMEEPEARADAAEAEARKAREKIESLKKRQNLESKIGDVQLKKYKQKLSKLKKELDRLKATTAGIAVPVAVPSTSANPSQQQQQQQREVNLGAEVTRLQALVEETFNQANVTHTELQSQLAKKSAEDTQELILLQERLQQLEIELNEKNQQLSDRMNESMMLEQTRRDLEIKTEELDGLNRIVAELQSQIQDRDMEISQINSRAEEREISLKQENVQLTTHNQALQTCIKEQNEIIDQNQEEQDQTMQALANENAVLKKQLEDCQRRRASNEEDLTGIKMNRTEALDKLEVCRKERDRVNADNARLQGQLENLTAQLAAQVAETENMTTQLTARTTENANLTAQLSARGTENANMTQDMQTANNTIEQQRALIAEQRKQLNTNQTLLTAAQAEIDSLRQPNEKMQEQGPGGPGDGGGSSASGGADINNSILKILDENNNLRRALNRLATQLQQLGQTTAQPPPQQAPANQDNDDDDNNYTVRGNVLDLTCSVCLNRFDTIEHKPKHAFNCSHLLCSQCVANPSITNCPSCRQMKALDERVCNLATNLTIERNQPPQQQQQQQQLRPELDAALREAIQFAQSEEGAAYQETVGGRPDDMIKIIIAIHGILTELSNSFYPQFTDANIMPLEDLMQAIRTQNADPNKVLELLLTQWRTTLMTITTYRDKEMQGLENQLNKALSESMEMDSQQTDEDMIQFSAIGMKLGRYIYRQVDDLKQSCMAKEQQLEDKQKENITRQQELFDLQRQYQEFRENATQRFNEINERMSAAKQEVEDNEQTLQKIKVTLQTTQDEKQKQATQYQVTIRKQAAQFQRDLEAKQQERQKLYLQYQEEKQKLSTQYQQDLAAKQEELDSIRKQANITIQQEQACSKDVQNDLETKFKQLTQELERIRQQGQQQLDQQTRQFDKEKQDLQAKFTTIVKEQQQAAQEAAQTALASSDDLMLALKNEMSSVKAQLRLLETEKQGLEEVIQSLRKSLQDEQKQRAELMQTLQIVTDQKGKLIGERDDLNRQLQTALKTIEDLEAKIRRQEQTIQNLNDKLTQKTEELARVIAEAAMKEAELSGKLQAELDNVKALQKKVKRLEDRIANDAGTNQTKTDQLQNRLEETQTRLDRALDQVAELEREIEELRQNAVRAQADFETTVEGNMSEMTRLRTQINQLTDKRGNLQREVDRLTVEISNNQSQQSTLNESNTKLSQDISEKDRRIAELEKLLDDVKKQMEDQTKTSQDELAAIQANFDEKITIREKQLNEERDENTKLQKKRSELQLKLSDLKFKISMGDKTNTEREEFVSQLRQDNQKMIQDLTSQITALKQRERECTDEIAELQRTKSVLNSKIDLLQNTQSLDTAQTTQLERQRVQLDRASARILDLENQLRDLEQLNVRLAREVGSKSRSAAAGSSSGGGGGGGDKDPYRNDGGERFKEERDDFGEYGGSFGGYYRGGPPDGDGGGGGFDGGNGNQQKDGKKGDCTQLLDQLMTTAQMLFDTAAFSLYCVQTTAANATAHFINNTQQGASKNYVPQLTLAQDEDIGCVAVVSGTMEPTRPILREPYENRPYINKYSMADDQEESLLFAEDMFTPTASSIMTERVKTLTRVVKNQAITKTPNLFEIAQNISPYKLYYVADGRVSCLFNNFVVSEQQRTASRMQMEQGALVNDMVAFLTAWTKKTCTSSKYSTLNNLHVTLRKLADKIVVNSGEFKEYITSVLPEYRNTIMAGLSVPLFYRSSKAYLPPLVIVHLQETHSFWDKVANIRNLPADARQDFLFQDPELRPTPAATLDVSPRLVIGCFLDRSTTRRHAIPISTYLKHSATTTIGVYELQSGKHVYVIDRVWIRDNLNWIEKKPKPAADAFAWPCGNPDNVSIWDDVARKTLPTTDRIELRIHRVNRDSSLLTDTLHVKTHELLSPSTLRALQIYI